MSRRLRIAVLLTALTTFTTLTAVDIETLEALAWNGDRAKALARLVPDSDEHFYWRCVQLQIAGDLPAVEALLPPWQVQHPRSQLLPTIRRRQAVLWHDRDPAEAFRRLERELDLRLDASAPVAAGGAAPVFDATAFTWPALSARVLARDVSVTSLRDDGLAAILPVLQDAGQRRLVLERLSTPAVPGLAAAIAADLAAGSGRAFGALRIHSLLTATQLAELSRLHPAAAQTRAFVAVALSHVAERHADSPWRRDLAARQRYLEDALAVASNDAAKGLHSWLLGLLVDCDRRQGRDDATRFLAWQASRAQADNDSQPRLAGELGPIPDDLVDERLDVLLAAAPAPEPFIAAALPQAGARARFAAAKLLAGVGDAASWFRQLDEAAVAELQARVEVGFAPVCRRQWDGDEAVELVARLKHVDRLLVRVFRLDDEAILRRTRKPIEARIDLTGLSPHAELSLAYDLPAQRRHDQRIALPACAAPGTYVVELIGGPRRAHAVIRKGHLHVHVQPAADGVGLHVVDERGAAVAGAACWIGDRRFAAAADGVIAVPASDGDKRETAVIVAGARAALATLDLPGEDCRLIAEVLLDREQAVPGGMATALVRLRAAARATLPVAALRQPRLHLTWHGGDGVVLAAQDSDLTLADAAESVLTLPVPAGAIELRWRASARIDRRSGEVALSADGRVALAASLGHDRADGWLLRREDGGWLLHHRGLAGEPLADRGVLVAGTHRSGLVHQQAARTDAQGRIVLGPLPGVVHLGVHLPAGDAVEDWQLADAPVGLPTAIHAVAGQAIVVPWSDDAADVATLFVGGEAWLDERAGAIERRAGHLHLDGLPVGDYRLVGSSAGTAFVLRIHVVAGPLRGGLVSDRDGAAEVTPALTVAAAVQADALEVRVIGARTATRVHVLGAHAWSDAEPWPGFVPLPSAASTWSAPDSVLVPSQALDPESRYILDRRGQPRLPGVMLDRPGLLLNPWEDSSLVVAGEGGGALSTFGSRSGGGKRRALGKFGGGSRNESSVRSWTAFDWLPAVAPVLANLRPGADGVLRIPRASLGSAHVVRVIATDDGRTAQATLILPGALPAPRARALAKRLDGDGTLGIEAGVRALRAGESIDLADLPVVRHRLIDSLGAFITLLSGAHPEAGLGDFAVLADWPRLDAAARRRLYDALASHELHLFLARRDPAWFRANLAPYLASKLQPTFVDRWLAGGDLAGELGLDHRARLNAGETALLAQRLPAHSGLRRALAEGADRAGAVPDELAAFIATALALTASTPAAQPAPAPPPAAPVPAPKPAAEEKAALEVMEVDKVAEDAAKSVITPDDDVHRHPGRPKLYVESAWYRVPPSESGPGIVADGPLWAALAAHDPATPFLPAAGLERLHTRTELLLAIALCDLPFVAAAPRWDALAGGRRLTVTTPALIVAENVHVLPIGEPGLAVHCRVVAADDLRRLKERAPAVSGAARPQVAYILETVVVNLGSSGRDVQVLRQVPEGALPFRGLPSTAVDHVSLAAYGSQQFATAFYWPAPGRFAQAGARVCADGKRLAVAPPAEWTVADTAATRSWIDLPDPVAVLATLEGADLTAVNLDQLAWRGADRAFFLAATATLRRRGQYLPGLWAWSLRHGDAATAREFLGQHDHFVSRLGDHLVGSLLTSEPLADGRLDLVDIAPLVNPRLHRSGDHLAFAAEVVRERYRTLLGRLAHRGAPDARDRLVLTAALLMQDRVPEATAQFARIDPAALSGRVQYDYAKAWLAITSGDAVGARSLAATYAAHPVERWRERFAAVAVQAGEIIAGSAPASDPLAMVGPRAVASLRLDRRDDTLVVAMGDLPRCELRWHAIDLEALFSRAPFALDQGGEHLLVAAPGLVQEVPRSPRGGPPAVRIPDDWRRRNAVVAAVSGSTRTSLLCLADDLDVAVSASSGQVQVRVRSTGAVLPAAYIKVYREEGSSAVFHKDGASDRRGRFDFLSLTGDAKPAAKRYALYVDGDAHGSTVRVVE